MKIKIAAFVLTLGALAAGQAFAADVTGRWTGDVQLANGNKLPFVAELRQQGAAVTGKLAGINGAPDVEIRDGKIENDKLTFWGLRKVQNGDVRFDYVGAVKPDAIDIQILRADGSQAPLSTHVVRAPAG